MYNTLHGQCTLQLHCLACSVLAVYFPLHCMYTALRSGQNDDFLVTNSDNFDNFVDDNHKVVTALWQRFDDYMTTLRFVWCYLPWVIYFLQLKQNVRKQCLLNCLTAQMKMFTCTSKQSSRTVQTTHKWVRLYFYFQRLMRYLGVIKVFNRFFFLSFLGQCKARPFNFHGVCLDFLSCFLQWPQHTMLLALCFCQFTKSVTK